MPQEQFGATPDRGTDFAAHVLSTFVEFCNTAGLSYFVLFIDLVKAFDRVLREIVLGWPDHEGDHAIYLLSLGVSKEQAEWLCAFVAKHGCLFKK